MKVLSRIEDYLVSKAIRQIGGQKIMSIQIDITNACNLRCKHCYHSHHSNKGALRLDGWFEILKQYDEMVSAFKMQPEVIICGGEPTISPYLFPILKRAKELWGHPPITILTNGTKLNDVLLSALSEYNIRFQVSLDGPDSERHDAVRGEGNFSKALSGAKLAREYGFQVNVLGILSKKTSQWIPDFFEMVKQNGLNSMNFTRFIPQGYGSELVRSGEDDSLYGFELRDALRSIIGYSRDCGIPTATNGPLYHLIDPNLGQSGRFGFQGLIVDYKGNLKVSSRADYILGSVLEEGLKNLFLKHPLMKELRLGNINECGQCMYYKRCGGDRNISYATTGSFLEKDKGCWIDPKNTKLMINSTETNNRIRKGTTK